MSFGPKKYRRPRGAQLLLLPFLLGLPFQQTELQIPAQQAEENTYFPHRDDSSGFENYFSSWLRAAGEPSLLCSARDASVVSYRLVYLPGQTGKMFSSRVTVSADGSATALTILFVSKPQQSKSMSYRKAESRLTATDVRNFLNLVGESRFWSTPTYEVRTSNGSGRTYIVDASTWVFEGVSGGKYHFVWRRGTSSESFKEIVQFLSRDLMKAE